MANQYKKHYTLAQARKLLPRIREWLARLEKLRAQLGRSDENVSTLMEQGADLGGKDVNAWVKQMAAIREVLWEFQRRDILVKDIQRGLVDFPSIRHGREVFLCWEKDEDDIEFWHDLDSGYPGRERLSGAE
jgi:hypothetical protein